MVNIQSITVIHNGGTLVFNSAAENWAYIKSKAKTPTRLANHERIRKLNKMNEWLTAIKYQVEEKKVEDVILVFGKSSETIKRLEDENIRDLLFNEENIVVVTIFDIPPLYQTITIVYTSVGQEQIISTPSSASPLASRWET